MAGRKQVIRLLNVTTDPISLWCFFPGQFEFLRRHGFEVHVVSSPGELLEKVRQRDSVVAYAVRMSRAITPLRDLVSLARLAYRTFKVRPHIVHAHTPKAALLAMVAGWLLGCRVRIYHMHGLRLATSSGMQRTVLTWAERLTCRLATRVLCVSPSVREAAIELGLCGGGKIKVLGNGSINGVDVCAAFNPDRYDRDARRHVRGTWRIPDEAPVVGFVGRMVNDKGITHLFDAWCSLRSQFPALHLLLAGPTEPKDPLPANLEVALRSDDRICLTGHVDDTRAFYAAIDVFVLPSYREGLPIVLLEAAAMQLPVVASRIDGCVDAVVDGVTGTLVPPRDASALGNALRQYLVDAHLRHRHGVAGRKRAIGQFSRETVWQALLEEYEQLLRSDHPNFCIARSADAPSEKIAA